MATYKIIGTRFLRKYTEASRSPVYASNVEAEEIVRKFCTIPWMQSQVKDGRMTYHTDEVVDAEGTTGFDANAKIRDSFDAAMWCAEHTGGEHRAYANAAVYRWTLPDAAVGATITSLKVRVTSDPYNSSGVRLHLFTNSTGEVPTSCRDVRGEDASGDIVDDGTTISGAVPRTSRIIDKKEYWYSSADDVTITPAGGLVAQKYLFLTVAIESYATVRGNWIEGSAFIDNLVDIATSSDVQGWTAGETYDLSAPPAYDHEYKVAVDGVYPCVLEGNSAVKTLTLQKNGDHIGEMRIDADYSDASALSSLDRGELKKYLISFDDGGVSRSFYLPASSITCIQQVDILDTTSTRRCCLAICGTFEEGTFAEIPGFLLQDIQTGLFLPHQSLNNNKETGAPDVPGELGHFYDRHGGFAGVSSVVFDNSAGAGFVFLAKDGTSFYLKNGYYNDPSTAMSPPFIFSFDESTMRFTLKNWKNKSDAIIEANNILDGISMPRDSKVSMGRRFLFKWTGTLGNASSRVCIFNVIQVCAASNNRIRCTEFFMTYREWYVTYEHGSQYQWYYDWVFCNAYSTYFRYNGEVHNLVARGTMSIVGGLVNWIMPDNHASGAQYIDNAEKNIVCITTNWSDLNTLGVFTNMVYTVDTARFSTIKPDTYENFKVHPSFDFRVTDTSNNADFLVSGNFQSLGDFNPMRRLAIISGLSGSSLYPTEVDNVGVNPNLAAYNTVGGNILMTLPSASSDHIHTDISQEQGVIGLNKIFASFYNGNLIEVPQNRILYVYQGTKPGAMFTISSDTLSIVDTRTETGANVPTWQLTVSNLSIPFALPTEWKARKLLLSWATPPPFTAGSEINAWIKPEYLSDNPQVEDVAIYDASKDEVDGWRRLGTFAPDATMSGVTGYAVEFDLDVVNANNEIGRMATLLLTAYINLDDVNPASGSGGSGDTPELPQGVGTVSVNPVTGSITGINTGFKPDITLFG